MKEAARRYLDAGLCVLPARRDQKRPIVGSWKAYQTRLPTSGEIDTWFANGPDAVCIVCGKVSGNGELIDFDAGGELFERWCDKVRAAAPGLLERLVLSKTQSDGRHAGYRCEAEVCGNLKLAQRRGDDGKVVTLIETRGEGGLFLCAPTDGYEVIQGDLCNPPVLTEAERDVLLQAAWELNEYVPPVVNGPRGTPVGHGGPLSAPCSHNSPPMAHPAENSPISAHNADSAPTSADDSHSGDCPSENGTVGPRMAMSVAQGRVLAENSHRCDSLPDNADRPGDDFNTRGDVRAVLEQHGWTCVKGGENEYWRRPGKTSGWSATLKDGVFFVFSSNAAPFEPNQAYSPFSVYTLLTHGGDYEQAARALRHLGYGGDGATDNATGVNISAIVGMSAEIAGCATDNTENGHCLTDNANPGPIPEHLFHVPGLVEQVMDFTLARAPYPNVGLAFCGAIALQSYLCGRKVETSDDLRPNIYLLALASSGTGKDFPRKVNSRLLFEVGHIGALGDKFASGQGIQDALLRSPAMLFQNDEMDGVLRQINFDRENKLESIPNILLTLYTSADAVYPIRVKAGQKEAAHIDQPHLTLFGTATPQYFYEALSQRMLTNGFFARLIIVDIGKRSAGQKAGSARHLPEAILQVARWWAEYQPGTTRKNLLEVHPEPRVVPCSPEAEKAITALQRQTEAEYAQADDRNDEVSRVAWSRTLENAKKLALLYACSENHEGPVIGLPAVEWATAFAMHQTRRQLYLAATYVAENPFHAECLKLLRKIKESRGKMARRQLMRAMRCKAADFDQLVGTLMQQGDIEAVEIATKTKPAQGYRIT